MFLKGRYVLRTKGRYLLDPQSATDEEGQVFQFSLSTVNYSPVYFDSELEGKGLVQWQLLQGLKTFIYNVKELPERPWNVSTHASRPQ